MRKIFLIVPILLSFLITPVFAQEQLRVHNSGNLIYQQAISGVDSIKLDSNSSSFYEPATHFGLPLTGIDSITFSDELNNDQIYIIYNGAQATIINPYATQGITITDNAGHVTVSSTIATADIPYNILGSTTNGSLSLNSTQAVKLVLSNASITNPSGAAIALTGNMNSTVFLSSGTTNTLSDAAGATADAPLVAASGLILDGTGTLNIRGYKKHGIKGGAALKINNGVINVLQAASDGFNVKNYEQSGGTISLVPTGDGIDVTNTLTIAGGNLSINAGTADVKGLKATTVNINGGSTNITVSGNQSKAVKSSEDIVVNGGTLSVTASGSTVLTASGSGYDASYCTGLKSDRNIIVNNGQITINCPASNLGAKGCSADGNITINGGNLQVTTAGNGATYTNESGGQDSYSATCIKADAHIYLLAGTITCSSSGTGGKGIAADSTLTIGNLGAADALLSLTVTTSGNRFLVSGSGQNADYANPKAIKSEGNLTVNSGIITINCTQTTDGGEGLESKASLYIKGGQITATTYDDCINAATHIEVTGGTHSLTASGNDGMDSNGTLTISGGFIISKGAGGPEEGFDCDNNTFKVLGGIMVGTGGNTSNPTVNVSTQNSLKLSINPNQNICIKNAANQVVLMFVLPALPASGGPAGNNKLVMLFSDPAFLNGAYTIQYGGTITGGTNTAGYITGGTYAGGSSSSFTASSKLTSVSL